MEKGGILLVFFCIVFVLFMRKVISLRTIVLLSLLVIVLFYGFNLMRAEDDSDYQKNETLLGFFAMYVLSPPVAYCEVVREISPQFGGHTFSLIYVFLNRFGFGPYVIFERLQDFVYVPMPTNVYTIFQPFFLDFGQVGVGVFAVVYGVVSGITYRLMRNGNDFGKCMYLYTAYILVLQFFQENVFTVNLHVIQLTFFVYLCTQKRLSLSFNRSLSLKRALP
jgi:oligosaccharide repeat unit polymerase